MFDARLSSDLIVLGLGLALAAGCSPDQPGAPSPSGVGGQRAADDSATGGNAPSTGAPSAELTILCGGSFREPIERLVALYEEKTGGKAVLSFGQSEDHLPKVKMKAAGDLFVSHDPYVQYTEDAGAMRRWVQVGFVAPVLVVGKGNPRKIAKIEDLAQPNLKVVLPNPEYSTCGEMVFKLLEKKGIKDAVLANVGNALVRSHSEVATPIALGHREAGIMWNGVAHNWLDKLDIVPVPYEYDDEVRVGIMGLSYSKHTAEVEAFLKFAEEHGPKLFEQFGYVK